MSTLQTQTSGSGFFDLLTSGVGLVSRIRDVTGKRKGAKPSVYCTIAVPLDPKGTDNPRWTNFDVRAVGGEVIDLINSFRDRVAAGQRPRIQFTIGDIYGHAWSRSLESGAVEVRSSFKGRLIRAQETELQLGSLMPLTRGFGYAKVLQKDGSPVLCIAALAGSKDDVQYTHFECLVNPANEDAVATVKQLRNIKANDDTAKVLIGFEIARVRATGYLGQTGDRAGDLGTSNTADLVQITWIRVNGKPVALSNEKTHETRPDESADTQPFDDPCED
jgi:hypothetical protein